MRLDLPVPARALAIAAHPDDVEFNCGATFAKWSAAGCVVNHLICTDGSKGSWDPDVDQREGHVFVGNLCVGDATFHKELLRFEQTKALCGKLTRPQAARIDGNVYIRRAGAMAPTLVVWSPAEGENCTAEYPTLAAFQKAQSAYEQHGEYLEAASGVVFRSAELSNLQPVHPSPSDAAIPAEVSTLLGWPAEAHAAAGAYPALAPNG